MVFYTFSVTRWNGVFWGPSPHRFLFGSEGGMGLKGGPMIPSETESLNHLRQTLINLADLEALDLG